MKYLKSFKSLNESNRFLHIKEVLETIEDMCLDIKDEGFKVIFGIMPSGVNLPDLANFDENLNDLQIKKASLGKELLYVKFDINNNKDFRNDEKVLELFINTITSINNYLINEDLDIKSYWTKEKVVRNRSDHGRNEFFNHKNIDSLINAIDWSRSEKLSNIVSGINNIKIQKRDNIDFRYLLDVRIAFTGHPLLEEAKDFRIDIGLQATDSDYVSIKDIVNDFNQDNREGDDKEFEATVGTVRTKNSSGRSYLVMVDDKTRFYDGFEISDVSPLLLRLMSEFGSESIMCGILFIGNPNRQTMTLNKEELISNVAIGLISNLVVYIDIV